MEPARKANETALTSLELLYEVSREFAAALDLRTVLHRVLFLSIKNVGALSGSIIVLDSQAKPVESAFIIRNRPADPSTLQLRQTYDHGLAGWVARNREAALVSDTSQDERWLRLPDDSKDRTGPKSAVSAPILARDELVGVITLVHPQPGFFRSPHLELVKAIADQASIAILNARLYSESQRRAQMMSALAESARVINATLDLDEVLQRILEQTTLALQAQGALLALVVDDSASTLGGVRTAAFPSLEIHAATGTAGPLPRKKRIPFGRGIAGWTVEHGEGVIVLDAQSDPRFLPEVDQLLGFPSRSIVCAPVMAEGRATGVLEVVNRQEAFVEHDLLILTGIASLAGTAIRHAQLFQNLQAAHRQYRELFEDSLDMILITDWDGRLLEANRRLFTATGLDKEKLLGMTINRLHQVDQKRVGRKFAQLKSGKTISYEATLLPHVGRHVYLQVHVRKIEYEGASNLQWILQDITERKNLDSLRTDLTAMVYHDLRSPLANVSSSLEVLDSVLTPNNDPTVQSLLTIAQRSTDRIQRLTNSLLDINRLEAGQPIGDPQVISLSFLVEEALDTIFPAARAKDLEIVNLILPGLPAVRVDADMVRRVLINLLENAVKFTPAKGKIEIGAQPEATFIRVWVADTGPGIAASDLERIFEKFTRLKMHSGPRGLGLGLAYCRLAVAAHGGRIWVESQPNSGSRFIFTLPKENQPIAVP